MDEEVSKSQRLAKTAQALPQRGIWPRASKQSTYRFGVDLASFCFVQLALDPLIAMENILDRLKLLDYENQFCKKK